MNIEQLECKQPGCTDTKLKALGYCQRHYADDLARRKFSGEFVNNVWPETCTAWSCDKPSWKTGLCSLHYHRRRRARLARETGK